MKNDVFCWKTVWPALLTNLIIKVGFFFNYLYIYHAKYTHCIKHLDPKMYLFVTSKASQLVLKCFFWAELESIIKTIFYTQREQFLWGYRSYISKHPFTVQSQFLATYKIRQRIASITKLCKGISHPGSLQFTNHLLAQTRCNAHCGLEATVCIWEGMCRRAKHWLLAPAPRMPYQLPCPTALSVHTFTERAIPSLW